MIGEGAIDNGSVEINPEKLNNQKHSLPIIYYPQNPSNRYNKVSILSCYFSF